MKVIKSSKVLFEEDVQYSNFYQYLREKSDIVSCKLLQNDEYRTTSAKSVLSPCSKNIQRIVFRRYLVTSATGLRIHQELCLLDTKYCQSCIRFWTFEAMNVGSEYFKLQSVRPKPNLNLKRIHFQFSGRKWKFCQILHSTKWRKQSLVIWSGFRDIRHRMTQIRPPNPPKFQFVEWSEVEVPHPHKVGDKQLRGFTRPLTYRSLRSV